MVTPIISMAPPKEGSAEWKIRQAREAAAQRLSNLVDNRLNDEKLLQQMEEKKRIVGPALTKAGSRLASEERRRNFLDDEDFFEVVDESDNEIMSPPSFR